MGLQYDSVRRTQVFSPTTTREAVQILTEVGDRATVLAGGTDLMVGLDAGTWRPEGIVLDIWQIDELRYIREEEGEIRIGALAAYSDLIRSDLLAREVPSLVEAAKAVGALQVQNRGTLGGNLMNASPAGDTMPPLLAAGASVVLVSNEGPRSVPLYSFYAGYRRPVAKPSELLTEVRIPPRPPGSVDYFRKVGTRRAQAISKVVMSGRLWGVESDGAGARIGNIRLGIGSAAPTPTRLFETERVVRENRLGDETIRLAVQVLASEITPIDDVRSTAAYRRLVAGRLLEEFLQCARA